MRLPAAYLPGARRGTWMLRRLRCPQGAMAIWNDVISWDER